MARTGADQRSLYLERVEEPALAHNAVRTILEDRHGFLWFGTDDGLQRFDGVDFMTFRSHSGELSLSHSRIQDLLEAPDGSLWIGTAGGLDVLSPDRLEITRAYLEAPGDSFSVASLALSPGGAITVATAEHGLRLVSTGARGQTTLVAQGPASWFAVEHLWRDDFLWLLLPGENWKEVWLDSSFEAVREREYSVPESSGDQDAPASAESIRGGHIFNGVGWVRITDEVLSGDGRWIGSFGGLFLRPSSSGEPQRIAFHGDNRGGLEGEVLSLVLDRSGTLWIGTFGGLFKADPSRKAFESWPRSTDERQPTSTLAVSPFEPDRLIYGTYGFGLAELSMSDGEVVRRLLPSRMGGGRCSDYVWSVGQGAGNLLVATPVGLCVFDRARQMIQFYAGSYRHVVRSSDGSFFATGGLDTLKLAASGQLQARYKVGGGTVQPVSESEVWIAEGVPDGAPSNAMLTLLNPATKERSVRRLGRQAAVYDLANWQGSLLLATSDGLLRLTSGADAPDVLMPSSRVGTVYSVQRGEGGVFWLGTSRGVARLDLTVEPAQIFVYDSRDGFINVEFNRRSSLLAGSRVLLGGNDGITTFEPTAIGKNAYAPPTYITEVEIEGVDGRRREAGSSVRLQPDDYAVDFRFAALNFTRAELNRYRYRLLGADLDWVDARNSRSARYSGLRPGSYSFEVVGSNNDGVWGEAPAVLSVRVLAPFYATGAFRLAAVLVLAGILAGLYRARVRRLIELERIRLGISTDLHDELGSELAGIALASAVVRQSGGLDEANRRRLASVEETSRRVIEGLRDIVWYVNPEHDRTDSMVDRMRNTARRLSEGLLLDFNVEGIEPASAIGMQTRRHLHLALKELVTNAAKHSGGQRIQVDLRQRDGTIELAVADDGEGFKEESSDGSGLLSLRRRAESLKGTFEIASPAGSGTRAVVRVPAA